MSIDRGDTRRLKTSILEGTTPTDPDALTLTVRDPAGVSTTYVYGVDMEIVRDAVGVYHVDLLLNQTGFWTYEWHSTTPDQLGGEISVRVQQTPLDRIPLSPGLTLQELKNRLGKELNGADDELQAYLDAAYAQAQAPPPYGCGRSLTPNPAFESQPDVEMTFAMTGHRLPVPDARSLSQVLVDGVASDYRSLERNGYIVAITLPRPVTHRDWCEPRPTLPVRPEVTLTGRFGFSFIPPDLAEAIYMLAARYSYEKAAQYADQVAILEDGAVQNYYRQLPPRTKLAFSTYAVPSFAGMTLG